MISRNDVSSIGRVSALCNRNDSSTTGILPDDPPCPAPTPGSFRYSGSKSGRRFHCLKLPKVAPTPVVQVATPKPSQTSDPNAEATYREQLQQLIAARKKYPRMAEKMEVEGKVKVAFTVLANGTITDIRIANSSNNQWLDEAALAAVKAASGQLPFPTGVQKTNWSFVLTVNFQLGE